MSSDGEGSGDEGKLVAPDLSGASGYLVVMRMPELKYRGVDRTPVFGPEDSGRFLSLYDPGPGLPSLERLTDDLDLSPTLESGSAALRLCEAEFVDRMELVFVQAVELGREPIAAEPLRLLGIDVAAAALWDSMISGRGYYFDDGVPVNEFGLLDVVPVTVVYSLEAGGRLPRAVCGLA